MDIHDPDHAARRAALATECRSLLRGDAGMDTVQELLSSRHVSVIDAILVTRELLGAGPGDLGRAKLIVLSAPSRHRERHAHEALADEILEAARELEPKPADG